MIVEGKYGPHRAVGLLLFRVPAGLGALVVCKVAIASCRTCEFCTTSRAVGLGCGAGLFALVSKQVAESRKFASIAAVLPALRFRSLVQNSHRSLAPRHRLGHHVAGAPSHHWRRVAGSIHLARWRCTSRRLAIHAGVVKVLRSGLC